MKKYYNLSGAKKLLIPLVVILGILAVVVFSVRSSQKSVTPTQNKVQEVKTTLSVDSGFGPKSFDIASFVGKTALETTQTGFKVVTSGTGVNAFVMGIDGRTVDSKKHEFWQFDVNGTEAQVGAGSYTVQKGDLIIWHIATY